MAKQTEMFKPLFPGLGEWEVEMAFETVIATPAPCCNKVGIFRSGARVTPHSDCVWSMTGISVRKIRDAEGMR